MASVLREADLGKCKRAAGGPGIAYSVFKIYVSRKGPLFPAEHCCVSVLLAVSRRGNLTFRSLFKEAKLAIQSVIA